MISSLLISGGVSAAVYVTTRLDSYLCTPPQPGDRFAFLHGVRTRLSESRERLTRSLGDNVWTKSGKVVIENAWISVFAVSLFLTLAAPPLTAGVIFSCLAIWAASTLLATAFSRLFVKPKDKSIVVNEMYQRLLNELPNVPVERAALAAWTPNLTSLTAIPQALYDDPVFKKYTCVISLVPIRNPVGDPNGSSLYERSTIVKWITTKKPISPLTNLPLTVPQLVEKPRLAARIDARLRMHQKRFHAELKAGKLTCKNRN